MRLGSSPKTRANVLSNAVAALAHAGVAARRPAVARTDDHVSVDIDVSMYVDVSVDVDVPIDVDVLLTCTFATAMDRVTLAPFASPATVLKAPEFGQGWQVEHVERNGNGGVALYGPKLIMLGM